MINDMIFLSLFIIIIYYLKNIINNHYILFKKYKIFFIYHVPHLHIY